jgi:hypothetical protein
MTHDCKRHGTTALFAALNMLDGTVIGHCQQRHTHAEWFKFLTKIYRKTPRAYMARNGSRLVTWRKRVVRN